MNHSSLNFQKKKKNELKYTCSSSCHEKKTKKHKNKVYVFKVKTMFFSSKVYLQNMTNQTYFTEAVEGHFT